MGLVSERIPATEIVSDLWLGDFEDAKTFRGRIICVLEAIPDTEPQQALWIRVFPEPGKADRYNLNRAVDAIQWSLRERIPVLVHCGAGVERSPLVVVWFLHKRRGMTIEQAYELVKSKRPIVEDRSLWLG